MKKIRGRLLFLLAVSLGSMLLALPSFPSIMQTLPESVQAVFGHRGLTLGLDLQGGIHLVLEVEEERAVELAVERSRKALED